MSGRHPRLHGVKPKGVIQWVSAEHSLSATIRRYDRLFAVPEPSREEDAYFYLAGARDDLNALERIDSYTKEIHDEFYVPKNER